MSKYFLRKQNGAAVTRISLSAAVSQLGSILSLPILTRFFGVEVVSIFGFLSLSSTFLSIMSTFKIESAVLATEESENLELLWRLSKKIIFIGSFIVTIIVSPIFYIWRIESAFWVIVLFLPGFICTFSFGSVYLSFAIRNHDYRSIAFYGVVRSLFGIVFSLIVGLLLPSLILFLLVQLLSQLVPILLLRKNVPKKSKDTTYSLRHYFKDYRVFAVHGSLEYIGASAQSYLPLIYFQIAGNIANIAGYYLGTRILMALNSIFIESARPVIFNEFRKLKLLRNSKNTRIYLVKSTLWFTFIPLILGIVLSYSVPFLIAILFNSHFDGSLILIQIIVFAWFAGTCQIPSYCINSIYGNFDKMLYLRVGSFGIQVTIFITALLGNWNAIYYLAISSVGIGIISGLNFTFSFFRIK